MRYLFVVFLILHALVHLLYFGQSARYFELKPGMTWPDGSWAFSKLLGDNTTRILASIALILAAVGLVVGGIGLLASQGWWRSVTAGAAGFSIILYILFWNGRAQNLDGQGAVGILFDIVILLAALFLRLPNFGF